MKVAIVSRIKASQIKKMFPWSKRVIMTMPGLYVVLDTEKISDLQKELLRIYQNNLAEQKKREVENRKMMRRMNGKLSGVDFLGEPVSRRKRK